MISKWTSHLSTEQEKEKFKQEILGSKNVLERQNQMLKELDEEAEQTELNPKFYELPNWDYRQASNNGFRRCLALVRKINNLDQ